MQVCAPAEKAWPRLIAASYLVVTGLIKDDEPSLSLFPLPLSLSLPPSLLLAEKQIDSLQSPIMGCFWKGEEIGKMMARGGERGGRKARKDSAFHFSPLPLRGRCESKKLAECLRAAEVHRLQLILPSRPPLTE